MRINHIPNPDDKFLYHFTTSESLMEILKGMTLKLSSFENLNDLNETDICCNWSNSMEELEITEYIKSHCGLLSFSRNFESIKGYCVEGYNHPRMWSQYAQNNTGACVIINEDRFLEKNQNSLKKIFYKVENVKYVPFPYDENISINGFEPKDFIENYYQHLFFNKHADWEQEGERRLLCIDGPKFLSILDCVEFICLGNKFNNENLLRLTKILTTKDNPCFFKLKPHDFLLQTNSFGHIVSMNHSSCIIEKIQELENESKAYIDYLNQNGYFI